MQERLDREQPGEQRYKDHADYGYTSAGHELLYPQIGVKPCSMAGGGVSKNIYGVFKNRPGGDRSGRYLLHLRDGFEIEMNFDRNVSCLIAVDVFMDNDFFNQAV